MRTTLTTASAALALIATATLSACGSSGNGSAELKKPSPTKTTTTTAQPSGPKTSFGPGKYKVGTEIAPGSYSTAGPSDATLPNCYWARERNNSGNLSAIITNATPAGPTSVTVNTGEYFETQGCKTWHKN